MFWWEDTIQLLSKVEHLPPCCWRAPSAHGISILNASLECRDVEEREKEDIYIEDSEASCSDSVSLPMRLSPQGGPFLPQHVNTSPAIAGQHSPSGGFAPRRWMQGTNSLHPKCRDQRPCAVAAHREGMILANLSTLPRLMPHRSLQLIRGGLGQFKPALSCRWDGRSGLPRS